MYSIRIEPRDGLVDVTLGGMLSVAEVDAYIAELKQAFVHHRLRDYAMVLDVSACPIQQQAMVAAMGEHMRAMPKARAIAVVTGSSLARMQVRRLFTQPYARIVDTVAQGRAWALHGVEPAAAATPRVA